MDQNSDKEERKREYNRLAQREFRRRRKEHLKNLEQAQKEQNSEQSEEIERLRYQNDELRRENETLKAQIYGASSLSSSSGLLSAPLNASSMSHDNRQYSLSPSISGASMSGGGSPPLGQDMMAMASLSLSSSVLAPSMQAYADPALSSQPFSMVHQSGNRHNSQSSPESSGYRTSRSMGTSFQPLNVSQPSHSHTHSSSSRGSGRRRSSAQTCGIVPYDRHEAQRELIDMFRLLCSDPSIPSSPQRHLAMLSSIDPNLPTTLRPSKAQLETPHYYGIDLIASPSLRDRLMTVTSEVAESFISEISLFEGEDVGQLTIWGDEPLNEMSWEFSQTILDRWGWLLGRDWINRANWWRRQRGAAQLPEW